HTVTFIDSSKIHFSYKNKVQRVMNFFNKTLLNKNIKSGFLNKRLKEIIRELPEQDTILIINPSTFTEDIVQLLKTKTRRYLAHNYDSLERHPLPYNYRDLFDKVFSFDMEDVKK